MGFLNKKAVEALPLRYIIIALVAALVIGIALQFVGVLKGGILYGAERMNESTSERITCSTDNERPTIESYTVLCTGNVTTVTLTVTDDCGIDDESVGFFTNKTGSKWTEFTLTSGDKKSGSWTGSITNATAFSAGTPISVTVSLYDLADEPNQKTDTYAVACS